MLWLTDVLVERQSHIDYRHYVEQAHLERARVFHKAIDSIVRSIRGVPNAIRSLIAQYGQWRTKRVTIDVLSGLSDHMLKDIGLTRGDIQGIAAEVAKSGRDVSVLQYRAQVVDQVDDDHEVAIREVAEETRIENNLRRAA